MSRLFSSSISREDVIQYHDVSIRSLDCFYSELLDGTVEDPRFFGYTKDAVREYAARHKEEEDLRSVFVLMAYIEACFQKHYMNIIGSRKRSPFLVPYKTLKKEKQKEKQRVVFGDLLDIWTKHVNGIEFESADKRLKKQIIGEIRQCLYFRHWLAHGRYWTIHSQRKVDFARVSNIALSVDQLFDA